MRSIFRNLIYSFCSLLLQTVLLLKCLIKKHLSSIFPNKRGEEEFLQFLDSNEKTWLNCDLESVKYTDGKLLVELLVPHDGYNLVNLIMAKYFMICLGVDGAALLNSPDARLEKLCRSYGIDEFYYLSDRKNNVINIVKYISITFKIFLNIKNISQFLSFEINKLKMGIIIYDSCLRKSGVGSFKRINSKLFNEMVTGLSLYDYTRKLFGNNKFCCLIQSERQFIPSGIVFQNAIINNLPVYSRGGGPSSFTIKKYEDIDNILENTHRYDEKVYDYVWQNMRYKAVQRGGELIFDRFRGDIRENDISDAKFAFGNDQEIVSRELLCKMFEWDPAKKIVIVMSNMLTDGVFTNRWYLFRDLLTWLEETLKQAGDIDNVNWLVKPHPSDVKNKVKITARDIYDKYNKSNHHVKFIPDIMGSRSLPGIVDAVLTVRGSAGIEYSCFGIPCVIAGESLYSGLGFVHEPQTVGEYFDYLHRLDELKTLSDEQVERAKTFAYIYLELSRVKCSLVPQLDRFSGYEKSKLWSDFNDAVNGANIENDRLYNMMQIMIKHNSRQLINYDWLNKESYVF